VYFSPFDLYKSHCISFDLMVKPINSIVESNLCTWYKIYLTCVP